MKLKCKTNDMCRILKSYTEWSKISKMHSKFSRSCPLGGDSNQIKMLLLRANGLDMSHRCQIKVGRKKKKTPPTKNPPKHR